MRKHRSPLRHPRGRLIAGVPHALASNPSAPGWSRSTQGSALANTANPFERACDRIRHAKSLRLANSCMIGALRKTVIIPLSGAKSGPRHCETRRHRHWTLRALERSDAKPHHWRNLRSNGALSFARAPSTRGTSRHATEIRTGHSRFRRPCYRPCSIRLNQQSSHGQGSHFGHRRARHRCCHRYSMRLGWVEYCWTCRVPANRRRSNRRADLPWSSVPSF